jgi:hypothetical protein
MAEAIALRKVTKRFSGVTILDEVNLEYSCRFRNRDPRAFGFR